MPKDGRNRESPTLGLREGLKANLGILEVWEGEYSQYSPSGDALSHTGASPGSELLPGGFLGVLEGRQSLGRELWSLGSPSTGKRGISSHPRAALIPVNSQRELGWREAQSPQTGSAAPPEGWKDLENSGGGRDSCSPRLLFPGNVDLGMLHLALFPSHPSPSPRTPFQGKLLKPQKEPAWSRNAGNAGPGMREGLAGMFWECRMSSDVKIPGWSAPGEHKAWLGQDLNYN